jgi:hypothetical protein
MTSSGEVGWMVRMDDDKAPSPSIVRITRPAAASTWRNWTSTVTGTDVDLRTVRRPAVRSLRWRERIGRGFGRPGGCDLAFVGDVIAAMIGHPLL